MKNRKFSLNNLLAENKSTVILLLVCTVVFLAGYYFVSSENEENISEELGDLIFSAVNVSRFLKVEPEEALTKSTEKFISRFEKLENAAKSQNKELSDMSLSEMDKLWENIKKQ